MNKDLRQTLLKYREQGLSIFPVSLTEKNGKVNKKPLVAWKIYQSRFATDEEIKTWSTQFPNAGIGCVTGKISGFVVVDVDSLTDLPSNLQSKIIVKSGGRGTHHYFSYPAEGIRDSVKKIHDFADVRGDGGFVVLPPTKYPLGDSKYEWITEFNRNFLVPLPKWIVEKNNKKSKKDQEINWNEFTSKTYFEGERNSKLTQYIGHLLSRKKLDLEKIYKKTLKFNEENLSPQLSQTEVQQTLSSIAETEIGKRQSSYSPIYSSADDDKYPFHTNPDQLIDSGRLWSITDLRNIPLQANEWLVEGLIPQDGITCIAAEPKTGKSYVCLSLAQAVASGQKAFNFFTTQQCGVLYVNKEDSCRLIYKRLEQFNTPAIPLHFLFDPTIYLDNLDGAQRLVEIAHKCSAKFIILDSLRRFLREEENESTETNKFHESLKILQWHGLTILFTHHLSKPGLTKSSKANRLRGSTDIQALLDSLIFLDKKSSQNIIKVEQPLLRQDIPLEPFCLSIPSFSDSNHDFTYQEYKVEKRLTKKDLAESEILQLLRNTEVLTTQEIRKLLEKKGIKETTIKNVLNKLIVDQKIEPANSYSNRGKAYQLKREGSS